jgi:hypothetical protein
MITREDISIDGNPSCLTISAMVNGYREKMQYIFWDTEDAIENFLTEVNND